MRKKKLMLKISAFLLFQMIMLSALSNTSLRAQDNPPINSSTLSPRIHIFAPSFQQSYESHLNSANKIAGFFKSSSVEDLVALDFVKKEFQRLDILGPGETEKFMGHIYTAGVHSRNVLKAMDEIAGFKDSGLLNAYKQVEASGKMWVLRFATLFHDLGKGIDHDYYLMHPGKGANKLLALLKDTGIKLNSDDSKMIRWLMLFHHHMAFFTSERDPYDEDTIIEYMYFLERFSKEEAKLATTMLYLLSYADATGVNMDRPTNNHQRLMQSLPQFYNDIMVYIDKHNIHQLRDTLKEQKKQWLQSMLPEESEVVIQTYIDMTPVFIIAPHRMKHIRKQINILKNATAVPQINMLSLLSENFDPLIEMTVTMKKPDNVAFLSKLTAIFYLNGLDIRRAEINTTDDGIILDRFLLKYSANAINNDTLQILSATLNQDLDRVFKQGLSTEKLFAVYGKNYTLPIIKKPSYLFDTKLELTNDSPNSTLMTIETTDRVGLMHIISRALFDKFGINIHSVELATEGYKAKDTLRINHKGKALGNDMAKAVKKHLTQLLDSKEENPFNSITTIITSQPKALGIKNKLNDDLRRIDSSI